MSFQLSDEIPIEPITVDLNNLELTPYPFKVKKAIGLLGAEDGKKYNGYLITMTVDPHDALGIEGIQLPQFPYEAVVHSATEVDVTAPLLEFNERGGHDEFIRTKFQKLPEEGTTLVDAMDNSRKRYELKYGTMERINKKIYRLQFPAGTKLDGKVLKCNGVAVKKNEAGLTLGGYTIHEPISVLNQKPEVLETSTTTDEETGEITTETFLAIKCNVVPKLFWRVADVKEDGQLTGPSFIRKGQTGTDAANALFGRALIGISRSNVDPPSNTGDEMDSSPTRISSRGTDASPAKTVSTSNVVPVKTESATPAIPVSVASGAAVFPDNATSGIVPDNATSGGAKVFTGSSLKQAMTRFKEAEDEQKLNNLINEGMNDLKEGWKRMGLIDEEMSDAKDSKKRDRSFAEELGASDPLDEGELLAPFPLVPDPVLFVQENLGWMEMERIMQEPPDQRQSWLMCYLKDVLLIFSDKEKRAILAHPREDRFQAMKRAYERIAAENAAILGAAGQGGSS